MESIISTFHIDWKIIIAQAINFAIVFAVLYIYALKPLSKLMQERSEKIAKGLDDAKKNSDTLSRTEQEYEVTLAKARKEAEAIFSASKKDAEAKKTELLEKTKEEVASMIEAGKKTLEAEKVKMVGEAKSEIISLTMLATEKLLGTKIEKVFDEKVLKELKDL